MNQISRIDQNIQISEEIRRNKRL